MDSAITSGFDAPSAERTLAHEMQLIRSAIEMVADDPASNVTLSGMSFGEALLAWAMRNARQSLVRVEPVWRFDGGCDLRVYADDH